MTSMETPSVHVQCVIFLAAWFKYRSFDKDVSWSWVSSGEWECMSEQRRLPLGGLLRPKLKQSRMSNLVISCWVAALGCWMDLKWPVLSLAPEENQQECRYHADWCRMGGLLQGLELVHKVSVTGHLRSWCTWKGIITSYSETPHSKRLWHCNSCTRDYGIKLPEGTKGSLIPYFL